jgi:hypothetical protein
MLYHYLPRDRRVHVCMVVVFTTTCAYHNLSCELEFRSCQCILDLYRFNVQFTTTSSIVVVEPDGRQGRQIISGDDGLNGPTGLYFDKSKNSLLVANYKESCFLYDMPVQSIISTNNLSPLSTIWFYHHDLVRDK